MRFAVVIHQCGEVRINSKNHRSAVTAVAAVRTAERPELLTMHRGAAISTVSAVHVKGDPVDKAGNAHGSASLRADAVCNDERVAQTSGPPFGFACSRAMPRWSPLQAE